MPSGAAKLEDCLELCSSNPSCTAIEWYPIQAGYQEVKCHSFPGGPSASGGNSRNPVTQGGGSYQDAQCYVRQSTPAPLPPSTPAPAPAPVTASTMTASLPNSPPASAPLPTSTTTTTSASTPTSAMTTTSASTSAPHTTITSAPKPASNTTTTASNTTTTLAPNPASLTTTTSAPKPGIATITTSPPETQGSSKPSPTPPPAPTSSPPPSSTSVGPAPPPFLVFASPGKEEDAPEDALPMTVEGVITLTVSDAESFASEPEVQEALQAVVATSLPGVDPSDVFITGIEVLLRRLSATRVLQGGGVRVDYVVAVPAELDATAVSESLAQVTP